jgi:hypothetical protein
MICRVVGNAIVCSGRQRAKRCKHCGSPANLLCDFATAPGKTCDAPICPRCATPGGKNVDFCKDHRGGEL